VGEKDPNRRAKRKAAAKPLDDELIELASVLAEYQLDNNAYGWFRPPWRNGDWATRLPLYVARLDSIFDETTREDLSKASAILSSYGRTGLPNTLIYEEAGTIYRQMVQPKLNTPSAGLIAASMRCLQLFVSNSHGGGAVYNEVLIPAFLGIEPDLVENAVLEYRCLDSIGTTHILKGDRNDRQRAAFTTAWRRGLYLAAYALSPAF
jgi:hypothetical protein